MIYLDSSALVKLVVKEPESADLRAWLDDRLEIARYTSALARTEVPRAVRPGGDIALLGDLFQIPLTPDILDEAGAFPGALRSFDAIHVTSAKRMGSELVALVAYDQRLLVTAEQVGLAVASPGAS